MSEDKLQAEIYKQINHLFPITRGLFYAVPNGGYRNKIEAMKLLATGTLPGVSDLILDIPNQQFHGLKMELKLKGKTQSPNQIKYQQNVTKHGYLYTVVFTLSQAIQIIAEYLNQPIPPTDPNLSEFDNY
jgi:hypothetical protein